MSVVARRLGMDTKDPELEQRLRRIEQVLAQKADANEFADEQAAANQDIPKPDNLTSEYHVTKWKVTWDPVEIPDVKRYEIRVGSDSSFSTVLGEYVRTEPEFTYPGASADITYFIIVRAVNFDGENGPWSDTLDVQTGQVSTADIEENALTQLWEFNQTDGFIHLYDGDQGQEHTGGDPTPAATTDTYGPITITVSSDSAIVLPFANFDAYYQSIFQSPSTYVNPWIDFDPLDMPNCNVRIRFDRAPNVNPDVKTNLMDMYLDYFSTVPFSDAWEYAAGGYYWSDIPIRGYDVALTRISIPLLPDAPGAGIYDYTFTVDVLGDTTTFIYFLPTSISLRFLEYKNT